MESKGKTTFNLRMCMFMCVFYTKRDDATGHGCFDREEPGQTCIIRGTNKMSTWQKCVHCVCLTDAVGQSVTPSTPHDCRAVCLPSPSRRRLGVIDLTSADAPTPPPTPTTYYATATQQGQSRARAVISVGLITKHKGGSSREPQALHPCRMGSVRLPEIDSNISGWLADFHLRCARW